MLPHQTLLTPDDLLRFYLRGSLDDHSLKTHVLLTLIDQRAEQRLVKGLLEEAVAELQRQARDIAAPAAYLKLGLTDQSDADQADPEPAADEDC